MPAGPGHLPSKVEGELTRQLAGLAVRILASMARKGAQRTVSDAVRYSIGFSELVRSALLGAYGKLIFLDLNRAIFDNGSRLPDLDAVIGRATFERFDHRFALAGTLFLENHLL